MAGDRVGDCVGRAEAFLAATGPGAGALSESAARGLREPCHDPSIVGKPTMDGLQNLEKIVTY
jgi:hypothetical protein